MLVIELGAWLTLALRRLYGDRLLPALAGAALLLLALLAMVSYQSRALFHLTFLTLLTL
jgi:hypothetical protein